jgi:hypothetical protein
MKTPAGLQRTQSARYQIKIQGRQIKGWSDWMDDLEIVTERSSEGITLTTLSGVVKDQAGLHGMLNRIRDLSIPLVSVQYMNPTYFAKE